jgi:two-component system nitrogen regulation response regulator GlnG
MPKPLVVDDEPNVLYSIEKGLQSDELEVVVAPTGRLGIELVAQARPDAVILDVRLSDMSGLEVFDSIRKCAPRLPVIIITAYASTETAIEAMKRGAFEYLLKPVDLHQLREVVQRALELSRFRHVPAVFEDEHAGEDAERIIGHSAAMQDVYKAIGRFAPRDETVLITGESGTGKEIIAQAIHTAGSRTGEPFVGVNVAAIPRELLEAELFGYDRGAFTGARAEGNAGKFEQAGAGTILLDEIGEMPMDMQAKLLRVLQERVIVRLGGSGERAVHARVIATTHRDLSQLVDEGKFRMDLLYRLRVLSIELPPLRERPDDVHVLAQHYMMKFAEQQRKRVRELANVMESEVSLLAADAVRLERLATRLAGRFHGSAIPSTGQFRAMEVPMLSPLSPIIPLSELEKKAFLHALERSGQSVARAAEALGVSKVTFYAKLRSYGMHPKDRFDEEGPTSVRRQRGATPVDPVDPFEPPTRTSTSKIRTEK